MTRHQYGISALVSLTSFCGVGVEKCRPLSQATTMYVAEVSFPTGSRFSLALLGIKSISLKNCFFVTETAVCLNERLTFFSLVLLFL